MDRQVKAHRPRLLDSLAGQLNPIHGELFRASPVNYYWSTYPPRSCGCRTLDRGPPAAISRGHAEVVGPVIATARSATGMISAPVVFG